MLGTIQVDLDGIWTYRRYLKKFDVLSSGKEPVYEEGVKNFLELFKKYEIKATFFVVGRDLKNSANREIIKKIGEAGHEIANHTMSHPLRFSALSKEEKAKEIGQCSEQIRFLAGKAPSGFRAPVFSVDADCLALLKGMGYIYDASLVPSFISPILMKISHSLLRGSFFDPHSGNFKFVRAPLEAYWADESCIWKKGSSCGIVEVPVSVSANLRFPMHSTYVFLLGRKYFEIVFGNLKKRVGSISYLFHGIDLVDLKRCNLKLPLYPGLDKRKEICEFIVKRLKENLELLTTEQLARRMK